MTEVSAGDIKREIPEASGNPDLVSGLLRICQDYRLNSADLALEWDMLIMSANGKRRMTLESLADLEGRARDLAATKRLKVEKNAKQQFSSRPSTVGTYTKDNLSGLVGGTPPARSGRPGVSPHTATVTPPITSGTSSGLFSARPDAGKVLCTLNPDLGLLKAEEQPLLEVEEQANEAVAQAQQAQLEVVLEAQAPEWRLAQSRMWEKMEDRAQLLDAQVASLERALGALDGFPPLVSVVTTGAEEVMIVGRVCCEGEGKLNAQSIFLEGSRATSNACRVRLDLSACPHFALFPGQVVGVVGVNSVGHTFVARKVLPAMPPAAVAPAAAQQAASSNASPTDEQVHPVTLMTAAGPFTTTDDLTYSPLTALLAKAKEVRPDALVLVGPFVDEQHPLLAAGDLNVTYQELYERNVVARLSEFVETQMEENERNGTKVTQVVMIPSTRDVHHTPVYPQPALPSLCGVVPEHVLPFIHLAHNPASVRVGGVRVAAGSVDTLMLLGAQELARIPPPPAGQPKPDRMMRLASHLLQQRHMLPLFPAPSDERNPLPVDVCANLKAGALAAGLPDVLVCPSDLAPFAKIGHAGVLCLNPGRLTRKQAGGNYATVCVRPPPAAPLPPMALDKPVEEKEATAQPTPKAEAAEEPTVKAEIAEGATAPAEAATAMAAAAAPAATADALPAPCIVPAPADARRGLDTRVFVEVKRV